FERIRELILDGAIGDLKTIHGWDARQLPRPGYPVAEGTAPSFMHYAQWMGPTPYNPFNPVYLLDATGLNCLFWNICRHCSGRQMAKMGAHSRDHLWNSIGGGVPVGIE